jgi:ribosomal protein S18 acetylase RimI-like enzyme
MVLLIFISMVIGTLLVIKYIKVNEESFGAEAAVGAFSLIATLIGTFFVAYELKNTGEVTCCEMLINLNNYFHDSDRLMRVYAALDNAYLWGKNDEEVWQGVEDADVQFFCTFFENLSLLVQHKIAKIKDLDDLFGYRFFLFMNNPHIQEKYILTTSSSFTNLFELYTLWSEYRDDENKGREIKPIVGKEYRFTKEYLAQKMYLVDNGVGKHLYSTLEAGGKTFSIRDVWFDEMGQVLKLQSLVHEARPNGELYVDTTRSELIESLHMDYVLGAYDGDTLVAVATIIDNRVCSRNLGKKCGAKPTTAYTFDAVFVHPDYRGLGLQSAFLEIAKKQVVIDGATTIWCTVSPDNTYSYANFTKAGFLPYETGVSMYGGHIRDILRYEV